MALARLHGRQFPAGSRLDYNNTDVIVMSRLCEQVTKQTFDHFVRERLLKPLGLTDTFVCAPKQLSLGGVWRAATISRVKDTKGRRSTWGPWLTIASPRRPGISCLRSKTCVVGEGICSTDLMQSALSWRFCRQRRGCGIGTDSLVLPADVRARHESWRWGGRVVWGHRGSFFGYHSGTFIEPQSRFVFSMAMTMCTTGSFMRFIDLQGHDYMSFMQTCCLAGIHALELV